MNNIVSGFFILFEQLFLVGDFVEIGSARRPKLKSGSGAADPL